MDGESNYESDLSESWSLIDININEELPSVTEVSEGSLSRLKDENLGELDELEIEDFLRKCKETNKTEFSRISDLECDSSFKGPEIESDSRTDDNFFSNNKIGDEDEKNDSGDNESIEVLEFDVHDQDSELERLDVSGIDHLDGSTYQSDDEESSEGNRSNNSTVIRRRKRLSEPPENSVHIVDSKNKSSKENANAFPNENEKAEEPSGANSHLVYKHYRNNVVNTVLSLSVGVIFAGVACLAIGHFLGVQDASETAVELAETVKKLQEENAALQSALLAAGTNTKLELPLNQPHELPIEQAPPRVVASKSRLTDFSNAGLPAVHSTLNSMEWFPKINERQDDFKGLGKYILDRVHSLNHRMEEGAKFFENADKKISKYLRKIIKRLSSSQDNIEMLHERFIKLKDVMSQKLTELPNSPDEMRSEKAPKRLPVTELELQSMQWDPERKTKKSFQEDYRKSILFYNFPQPEKYYEKNPTKKEFELGNSNQTLRDEKQDNKKRKDGEKKAKKKGKKNWKREKSKEKKEKGWKKQKRAVNKSESVSKSIETRRKADESDRVTLNQVAFNLTVPQHKKYSKPGEKDTKHRRKCKKSKRSKLKKVLLSDPRKRPYLDKKQYRRMCSRPRCFNMTGHWVFKWADGREKFRRLQTVGEWQFDRAKARRDLRDTNYHENWQFKRAVAREHNRWNRAKYEKYFGKDFFHEKFSWI